MYSMMYTLNINDRNSFNKSIVIHLATIQQLLMELWEIMELWVWVIASLYDNCRSLQTTAFNTAAPCLSHFAWLAMFVAIKCQRHAQGYLSRWNLWMIPCIAELETECQNLSSRAKCEWWVQSWSTRLLTCMLKAMLDQPSEQVEHEHKL